MCFVCLFVCFFFTYCDEREETPGINADDRTAATGEETGETMDLHTRPSRALFPFTQFIHLSTPTTQMPYNTLTLRSRLSLSSITVAGKDPPSSVGNKRFFFPSSFLFSKPTAAIRYLPTSNGVSTDENLNRSKGKKKKRRRQIQNPLPNNPRRPNSLTYLLRAVNFGRCGCVRN